MVLKNDCSGISAEIAELGTILKEIISNLIVDLLLLRHYDTIAVG
jgi:hypothetical protein